MASAYVASARIDRGRPHLVATPPSAEWSLARDGRTVDERLVDTSPPGQQEIELRWAAVRERWSQLWFFVLDPESWR
jgi:hypothetical protein